MPPGSIVTEDVQPFGDIGRLGNGGCTMNWLDADLTNRSKWVEKFRDDPKLILSALGEWRDTVAELVYSIEARPEPFPCGLQSLSALLSLWCDRETTVDPSPLRELSDLLYQSLTRNCGQFVPVGSPPPTPPPMELIESALRRAVKTLDRLDSLAECLCDDKRSRNVPQDDDLVTATQVARIVGLEPRSMEPYKAKWPKPRIAASGRRPAQWSYRDLKPTLSEQFPHVDLPDSLPKTVDNVR